MLILIFASLVLWFILWCGGTVMVISKPTQQDHLAHRPDVRKMLDDWANPDNHNLK